MTLKQKRGAIKRSLAAQETFALKFSEATTLTKEEVEIRYEKLQQEFSEFQKIQTQIEEECKTETEEEEEYKIRDQLDEKFFLILGKFRAFIARSPQPPPPQDNFAALAQNQARLSEIVERLTNQGQGTPSPSGFQLQSASIPEFNGDYLQWSSFHDLFTTMVHNNAKLTPCQKLQYLKNALKGDAEACLRHFSATDANYEPAWEELKRRFNKKSLIIQSHLRALIEQPSFTKFSIESIRNLTNTTSESMCALNALGATSNWDHILIYLITKKLDAESRLLWSRKTSKIEAPTYDLLIEFLEERQFEGETMSQTQIVQPLQQQKQHRQGKPNSASTRQDQSTKTFHSTTTTCAKCSADHPLYRCTQYKELNAAAREQLVIEKSLCKNCLRPGHHAAQCKSKHRCFTCKQTHHTTLHVEEPKPSTSINHIRLNHALLPTVVLLVQDCRQKMQPCRAFLDSGAEETLVSEACIQRLGIRRHNARIHMKGANQSSMGTTRGSTQLNITSRIDKNVTMKIESFIVSDVTSYLPTTPISETDCTVFKGLELADPNFHQPDGIDILLSSDIFFAIIKNGKITINNLVALNTSFGWIIGGRNEMTQKQPPIRSHHTVMNIDAQLQQFWEIEEISDPIKRMTTEEICCEEHFANTHTRMPDGRYTVRLPLKPAKEPIGESKQAALNRLFAVERRFNNNHELRTQYVDFMAEYIQLGHMRPVRESSTLTAESFYLPHHAVIKETSSTTKLRVVFDASKKSTLGISLNDRLMVGPTIQTDLLSLLLRFRLKPIAMCADIAKMYRQIRVADDDTSYQRILWRESPSDPVQEFELTTVTYGTSSAPYLATKTLQQLANDDQKIYPSAATILKNDFYVDDLMSGAETANEAIQQAAELTQLLKAGGFELRKWSSNSNQFLSTIPSDAIECSYPLQISEDKNLKTLGLNWFPANDQFSFTVNLAPQTKSTKRTLLSDTAKIFDPLGWVSPCIVIPKMLFQKLWTIGLSWDDPLPNDIQLIWQQFRDQLTKLETFKIDRWITTTASTQIQLHGFCDASEAAYAAVVYSRVVSPEGKIKTHLIAAKTKVAPVKQVSIPRLELCGAQLLAKLMNKIKDSFGRQTIEYFLWTDSTIVLAWLADVPRKWKTFVANRTSEILTKFPYKHWHHVKSGDNPADIASRGCMPAELQTNDLWWHGPKFLLSEPLTIKTNHSPNIEAMSEAKSTQISSFTEIIQKNEIIIRYSTLSRLQRISAYCLRFAYNARKPKSERTTGFLTAAELRDATIKLVMMTQQQHFASEIKQCERKGSLPPSSKLRGLHPFVDETKILRVGGRLDAAEIPYNARHPAILPRHDHLTELFIKNTHAKTQHAGVTLTLNVLQQEYWIIGARLAVKKVIHQCITCKRHKGATSQQLMGNLPPHRIKQGRPFLKSGVDFAGPLWIKQHAGRNSKSIKAYVAVFVCLATKAIHLEPVSDLTSDAFIAALKRFSSRRGLSSDLFSDNGTNFVAANKELSELRHLHDQENISKFLASNGITWHFIPPSAPNFGGLWEAGVKSMKTHLRKVLGTTTLTFEALTTVLCQIEASLNSRPLCPKTPDPQDIDTLTPGHFLIGDQLTAIPEPNLLDISSNRLNRWQHLTQLHQQFWKKWHRDYLHQMQQRQKWSIETPTVAVGTIVTIKDENIPPSRWILGRIIELHPGRDGLNRVATVKTQNGILRRPLSKLCVLLKN